MSHWFKFYGQDWMTDPKIMLLTPVEKAAFVVLLCLASQTDDGRIKFFTEGRLKVMTGAEPNGEDWDALDGVLDKFASLNLIEVDEDNGGEILVVNFAKRQATNLTNAERQQKLRDKRNATSNGSNARIEKNSIEQKRKDEAFDIFWKAYPRKTSKKNARRSWDKLNLTQELLQTILTALEVQKKSEQWTKDGTKFIPHGATWLNQERWHDEMPEAEKTTVEKI